MRMSGKMIAATAPLAALFSSSSALAAGLNPILIDLPSLDGTVGFVINGVDAGDQSGVAVSSAGDVNGDGFDDVLIGAWLASPNGVSSGESYVVFGGTDIGATGVFELSSLDGVSGFVIRGDDAGDLSGSSVASAGDLNGDGFDDLVIGSSNADPNGNASGESHVVFGSADVGSTGIVQLSGLDGTNGFVLRGVGAFDLSGHAVSSAGDFNGDGIDDLLIGAYGSDPNDASGAGVSYVIFGTADLGMTGVIELSALDAASGVVLNGVAEADRSGFSISWAGDINDDAFDDVVIGADRADPNGLSSGETYVVFGGPAVGTSDVIELAGLNGTNGFVLRGVAAGDFSGSSVSSAGDVNADGIADVIIGAYGADTNGFFSGESYVVFGGNAVVAAGVVELSSLDGSNGFVVRGIDAGDQCGESVSGAGDLNGDGVDDLIIGASSAGPSGASSGETYVIFGAVDLGSSGFVDLSLLDGSSGVVLNGVNVGDQSGSSVSSAGDINGDGFDDVIIGARLADPNGNASGASYVVFGRKIAPGDPADLDGDGCVGATDLAILLAAWNTPGADIAGDGITGAEDIAILLAAWSGCTEAQCSGSALTGK